MSLLFCRYESAGIAFRLPLFRFVLVLEVVMIDTLVVLFAVWFVGFATLTSLWLVWSGLRDLLD